MHIPLIALPLLQGGGDGPSPRLCVSRDQSRNRVDGALQIRGVPAIRVQGSGQVYL